MDIPNESDILERLKALLKEGRACCRRGDVSDARHSFQQAMSLAADNNLEGEEMFFKGCLAMAKSEWESALVILESALSIERLMLKTEVLDRLAFVYNELEDFPKAIELLNKVLEDLLYGMRGDAWNNMGNAYHGMKEYDKAIECHLKAIAEEAYDAPGDAWYNIGNTYHDMNEYDKAIECYQKAIAEKDFVTPGDAWCYMGDVYHDMKNYSKAIECYERAITEQSYDTPGDAWCNMGDVYHDMRDYGKAIECYERAIAEQSYDTPGDALCNMGLTYQDMQEYSKAIECYQKAIADQSYNTPGYAWNNMGNTFSDLKEYEKALQCYTNALAEKSYDTPGYAWYNMALVHRNLEHFEDAQSCLSEAQKAFTAHGDSEDLDSVKTLGTMLEGLVRSRKAGQEGLEQRYRDAASLAEPVVASPKREGAESQHLSKSFDVRVEIDRIISNTTSTENYRQRKHSNLGNWLISLRGWSSSTNVVSLAHPEFYGGAKCCGGGFLINWRNKGHIIDPGTDFLETFCRFNLHPDAIPPHIMQIHSICATHRHPDHIGDLAAITQLDADVAGTKDRKLKFLVDKDTYDNIPPLLKERQGRDRVGVRILEPDTPIMLAGRSGTVNSFKVDHGKEAPNACGLTFSLSGAQSEDKIGVGFTGDTKWFPELAEKLTTCSIIVCNFSATRATDVGEKEFKKDHLGFRGILELINSTEAKIYVLTEFWGQLGDIRISIAQYLLQRIREGGRRNKNLPVVIPADVGLVIDIETTTIMCSHCQRFVPAEEIVAVPVTPAFGRLLYLCPRHMMNQK